MDAPVAKRMPPNAGKGRKKGAVNKSTRDVRLAIAQIARKNVTKINDWLDRIALEDPAKALHLYLRMIEFHIPKLSSIELTPEDKPNSRVIDSSLLTAEEREQLRQIILRRQAAEQLEHQAPNTIEPVALGAVIEGE